MNKKFCFTTAFFHAEGKAPNMRIRSESRKIEAYYKCIIVFFSSVRRFYPEERLILFTNSEMPNKYAGYFKALSVEIIIIPVSKIKYTADNTITSTFPGCLFTLDVIDYISHSSIIDDVENMCIFDSDCFFINDIDLLFDSEHSEKLFAGIKLSYPLNYDINGQSMASLTLIHNSMNSHANNSTLSFYGGEFYALKVRSLGELSGLISKCFDFIKDNRATFGHNYTEEHIMSLAMSLNDEKILDNEKVIKRVWTADNYSNIDNTELNYSVLHLPAEKDGFFKRIFKKIEKNSFFLKELSDDQYLNLVMQPINSCSSPNMRRRLRLVLKKIAECIIS